MEEELLSLGFKIKPTTKKKIEDTIFYNRTNGEENEELRNFPFKLDHELEKLKDVGKGATLVSKALDDRLHICVVTDYDSDGINSAVTLTKGLRKVFGIDKKNLTTIVNKRVNGNGFNPVLVKRIKDVHDRHKIDLIITADHGSVNDEQYLELKNYGIDKIVVTDHHEVKYGNLKNVDAFINPQREDSFYPKSVSGCFVAFMLLIKTYNIMFKTRNYKDLYQLTPYVGISTITDVMKLDVPINRHIVKIGLRELNSLRDNHWATIKAGLDITGLVTTKDIGFKIGPVINAGNATNNEEAIFKLLMAEDKDTLNKYLKVAIKLNQLRKDETKKVKTKALGNITTSNSVVTIIESELPIAGKVASALGTQFNLPAVCFRDLEDGTMEGSGRGIVKGLNILEIIESMEKSNPGMFKAAGGHKGAFGCTIYKEYYEDFKTIFDTSVKTAMSGYGDKDIMEVDALVPDYLINTDLCNKVHANQPYGLGWEEPVLLAKIKVKFILNLGSVAKIKFVRNNNSELDGIYFFNDDNGINTNNIGDLKGKEVYIAFTPRISSFRKSYTVELEIKRIIGATHG